MKDVTVFSSCRVCGSKEVEEVLSLGDMTLTGIFSKPDASPPIKSPLNLMFCNSCTFVQLANAVNPDLMYEEYWYRSGTNRTMKEHLGGIVYDVCQRIELRPGDICLDIGCNDGTLLNQYSEGQVLIGCDPSNAIEEITNPNITRINTYFTAAALRQAEIRKPIKAITSISMFYDLNDPNSFVQDIKEVLDEDGIWVVEMNYTGEMLKSLGFDMISHEHVGYYTLTSFKNLVERHDVYVNDVTFNEINGGSMRIFCGLKSNPHSRVEEQLAYEDSVGINSIQSYKTLMSEMQDYRKKLRGFLDAITKQGKKVALYGASTRISSVLQFCEIDNSIIYAAAERNPGKYGLVTSGSNIPILSEAEVRKQNPEYFFIGPYFFLDEFIDREKEYLDGGGVFIVPLPVARLLYKEGDKLIEKPL